MNDEMDKRYTDLDKLITAIADDTAETAFTRTMHEAEFAYMKADFSLVRSIYDDAIEADNAALRLAVSGPMVAAAISTGDYRFFTEIESWLRDIVKAEISEPVTAYAEYSLSLAYISMGVYSQVSDFMKKGELTALPKKARWLAAYLHIYYLIRIGKHDIALAVARAYLTMLGDDEVSIADIYLRINCADACVVLGQVQDAEDYLRGAMEKYLPIGVITPFSENMLRLGGICERLTKNDYPQCFGAVMELSGTVLKNWIKFHNHFAGENITSILSTREYHIARLYSMGESYKQIAGRFDISEGRVRNIMQDIYRTLFIEGGNRRGKLKRLIW